MKKFKVLSILTTVAIAAGVFSGCSKAAENTSDKSSDKGGEIKVGVVLALTGDVATFGESSKKALELLSEQVNKNGGVDGKNIKFIYEDDQNQPANSPTVAQKLIDKDEVVGIVGPATSKCAIAGGPIATSSKIPMVASTATNPDVTLKGGEYVFRACFIDPFQGTVMAKFASQDLKAKKAAVLFDVGNDYCKGLSEFFQKGFKEAGGEIVASETYNTKDTDFKAQLTKIKSLNPDVLFLPDYYNTVGLISKQARELGITATFLGGDGWDSDKLTEVAGDSINGGYFSNHYSKEDTAPEVVDFIKAYTAKYGADKTPDAFAALTYDGAQILIDAIKKAGSTDGEKIKEALKATNGTYVSGKVTYDENRNPVKAAVIIKMDAGKQKFVKSVNP